MGMELDQLVFMGTALKMKIWRWITLCQDLLVGFIFKVLFLNFLLKIILGMANRGTDSNGSQFYITTVKATWIDGKVLKVRQKSL